MANIIKIKRKSGASGVTLAAGELGFCTTDGGELYVGNVDGDGNILVGAANLARLSGATFTGRVILSGTQSANDDAATFTYVAGLAAGAREVKNSVSAATVPASPLNSLSAYTRTSATKLTKSSAGAFPTVDGVAAVVGNRYLLKDEGTGGNAADNGIWELTTLGDGGTAWVLDRASDSATAAENKRGQFCWVDAGTSNIKSGWLQNSVDCVTLGTSAITFAQVSGAQLLLVDNSTIQRVGDVLSLKDDGITEVQLAASIAGAGLAGGASTPLSVNVTGALEIATDAVAVKANSVSETYIATTVAGAGVTGGGGSALAVGAGTGLKITGGQLVPDFGTTSGHPLAGNADIDGGTWA